MNWTRRQHEAFWKWRYAFERLLTVKAVPVANNEEARMRFERLTHAQKVLADALEELEATVIDEFDASKAAPHTPWPGASPNKRNDDECTCAVDATSLCPIHHGYAR